MFVSNPGLTTNVENHLSRYTIPGNLHGDSVSREVHENHRIPLLRCSVETFLCLIACAPTVAKECWALFQTLFHVCVRVQASAVTIRHLMEDATNLYCEGKSKVKSRMRMLCTKTKC